MPKVDVQCACRTNHDIFSEPSCTEDSNHWLEKTCVYCNVSIRAQCWINIRPAEKEKYYTAYKIDHTNQFIFMTVSYSNGDYHKQINIPQGIHRIKISDNVILKFDVSHINTGILNAVNWFYGETNSNNIKLVAWEINEMNEWSLTKLGWYRENTATGKFVVDEAIVKRSLMVDDERCPTGDVKWTFKANHYYNRNGLLQSSLPGKSINDVTGMIVDNVIISSKDRTISIEYKTDSQSIHFLPSSPSESFNFSALITVDRYENKMIHITVYELNAQQVNAEIGIPGTTRSMISFYHEKANQIHVYRISASIIGSQWICAYPTRDYRRCTCAQAVYRDFSIPARVNYSNFSIYNPIGSQRKLAVLKNKTSINSDDNNNNVDVIAASATSFVIILIFALLIILLLRKRSRYEKALLNEEVN